MWARRLWPGWTYFKRTGTWLKFGAVGYVVYGLAEQDRPLRQWVACQLSPVWGRLDAYMHARQMESIFRSMPDDVPVLHLNPGAGVSAFAAVPSRVEWWGVYKDRALDPVVAESAADHGVPASRLGCVHEDPLTYLKRLPDESVPCIMSVYGVSGHPQAQQLLREINRVLRPGGRLYFVDCTAPTDTLSYALARLVSPLLNVVAGVRLDRDVLGGLLVNPETSQQEDWALTYLYRLRSQWGTDAYRRRPTREEVTAEGESKGAQSPEHTTEAQPTAEAGDAELGESSMPAPAAPSPSSLDDADKHPDDEAWDEEADGEDEEADGEDEEAGPYELRDVEDVLEDLASRDASSDEREAALVEEIRQKMIAREEAVEQLERLSVRVLEKHKVGSTEGKEDSDGEDSTLVGCRMEFPDLQGDAAGLFPVVGGVLMKPYYTPSEMVKLVRMYSYGSYDISRRLKWDNQAEEASPEMKRDAEELSALMAATVPPSTATEPAEPAEAWDQPREISDDAHGAPESLDQQGEWKNAGQRDGPGSPAGGHSPVTELEVDRDEEAEEEEVEDIPLEWFLWVMQEMYASPLPDSKPEQIPSEYDAEPGWFSWSSGDEPFMGGAIVAAEPDDEDSFWQEERL